MVRRGSLLPESAKIDKIQQWPRPDTGTGLASFLGLCNYYRTLVPSFAHVSDALYKASKMKMVEWTADLSTKFEELKALMLSAPVVRYQTSTESSSWRRMAAKWQSELV